MQQVFRYERRPGSNHLAGPGQAGLQHLGLDILRVPRDEMFRLRQEGREAVLVILGGTCEIHVDGSQWLLSRISVFAEPAMALYVPRHRQYEVMGIQPADVAVFSTDAVEDHLPRLIDRDQLKPEMEGAGQFRQRVYNIVDPEFPASRLLVGETFTEPGEWSSYPPHKHDEDNYPHEVWLEQISYFQIDPPQGFGLQYLYSADRSLDEATVVRDGEAIVVGRGYHPVVAAAGYSLYQLWGMAGNGHVIRASVDPAHAWVAAEAGVLEAVVPGQ